MDVLDARLVASATRAEGLPPPMFAEVAIAGRSNVGKSSLLNHMAQRQKLVRTSSTPGCTRAVNVFRLKLRGAEIDLVDLPGYGYAQRSKTERASWGPMIEGFLRTRVGLRAVVVLVDIRRGLEEDDAQLLEFLDSLGLRTIVVATKVDKVSSSERNKALAELRAALGTNVLGYSSAAGIGRDELWRMLLEACSIVVEARKPEKSTARASAPKAASKGPKATSKPKAPGGTSKSAPPR